MTSSAQNILWSLQSDLPQVPWKLEELLEVIECHAYNKDQFCVDIQANPQDALPLLFQGLDEAMLAFTQQALWKDLKTTAKIKHLLLERYRLLSQHPELYQSIFRYLREPKQWGLSMRMAWNTANTLWYAAGDTATDYNFYTKRALLGFVHGNTLRTWMQNPQDFEKIEISLAEGLSKVGKIGKIASDMKTTLRPIEGMARNVFQSVLQKIRKP